ncbi:Sirohydrochlorin cobaltochelatase [Roseimaritima multifibrata]|uniref:Sirohydrochlorin cobaltochelatase n=1 Tax=Roseimaritima multifibrata TaxID=1930274 RepID=A0A517MJX5_9BACT|nr:sirohydrochlorin chelatase [Roseimaritima multifibrata]QDS95195.1 Sirohydrochlorin cobaltochelatase [Roseimaritima multifibrata]
MSKTGLLLVGHGTRNDQGAEQFQVLTAVLKKQLPHFVVAGCFLELRPPTMEQAWQTLIEAGVTEVAVQPLLLFSAGHAKQDIPDAVDKLATPDIPVRYGRPLSRERNLVTLVCRTAANLLAELSPPQGSVSRTALVMVGRGSFDPCAQADMRLLAETVWRTVNEQLPSGSAGFLSVDTAFYAMAQPRLPEVLREVCSRGNVQDVIVQPHLLFAGQLHYAIEAQVQEVADQFPSKRILVGQPLGPDPLIAASVCNRIQE